LKKLGENASCFIENYRRFKFRFIVQDKWHFAGVNFHNTLSFFLIWNWIVMNWCNSSWWCLPFISSRFKYLSWTTSGIYFIIKIMARDIFIFSQPKSSLVSYRKKNSMRKFQFSISWILRRQISFSLTLCSEFHVEMILIDNA
jgi:hypothetical protein